MDAASPSSHKCRRAVLGGIVGAVMANQFRRSNDARLVGIAAGASIGALIGRDMDRRRCELIKIAKKHDVEIIVASIELPQGPLAAPTTLLCSASTLPQRRQREFLRDDLRRGRADYFANHSPRKHGVTNGCA